MKRLRIFLEMIKVEHTIFALPFAFLGAFLAAGGFPGWRVSFWILVAMTGARSTAMAFNRLVDRQWDALNPRTSGRALPQRLISVPAVAVYILLSALLFILAGWQLNPLALALSPVALAIVVFYSYTKRFTFLSHAFLGLSLAVAPVGGWVAVRGSLQIDPFILAAAVLFWVAGFDVIYACQDLNFDREHRLFSVPSRFGIRTSLRAAAVSHVLMMLFLAYTLLSFGLSLVSWLGFAIVGAALVYEHSLVKPDDLSRVDAAFFLVNGIISITLVLFVGLDLCLFE